MKTVIKKAKKGQYERKYRTTGKTGPASECVTKKIEKPTAQELWERIEEEIKQTKLCSGSPHPCAEILHMVNAYAKAYHEKQIKEKKERLLLEVETSICDCGEPYRESDLHDLIKEL